MCNLGELSSGSGSGSGDEGDDLADVPGHSTAVLGHSVDIPGPSAVADLSADVARLSLGVESSAAAAYCMGPVRNFESQYPNPPQLGTPFNSYPYQFENFSDSYLIDQLIDFIRYGNQKDDLIIPINFQHFSLYELRCYFRSNLAMNTQRRPLIFYHHWSCHPRSYASDRKLVDMTQFTSENNDVYVSSCVWIMQQRAKIFDNAVKRTFRLHQNTISKRGVEKDRRVIIGYEDFYIEVYSLLPNFISIINRELLEFPEADWKYSEWHVVKLFTRRRKQAN